MIRILASAKCKVSEQNKVTMMVTVMDDDSNDDDFDNCDDDADHEDI